MIPSSLFGLIGQLIIGDDPFGHFRPTSELQSLFAKAGWKITSHCPSIGWKAWAAEQVRQYSEDNPDAVSNVLNAMARPDEFLDRGNRVQEKARRDQIAAWDPSLLHMGCASPLHLAALSSNALNLSICQQMNRVLKWAKP